MATPFLVNGTSGVLATALFVRGGACDVQAMQITNPSTGTAYVQFYDTMIGPTVGTTAAAWSIGVTTGTPLSLTFAQPGGLTFMNGLWVAATVTNGGTGAPGTALVVNLAMS